MKKKSDVYEMIQFFFIEKCIPRKIVTDPAGELVGKEWKISVKNTELYHAKSKQPKNGNHNKTGAPTRFWSFCLVNSCAVLNHTAHRSLSWKTPYEMLHASTPDISVF